MKNRFAERVKILEGALDEILSNDDGVLKFRDDIGKEPIRCLSKLESLKWAYLIATYYCTNPSGLQKRKLELYESQIRMLEGIYRNRRERNLLVLWPEKRE